MDVVSDVLRGVRLTGDELRVANTGSALTAAGVAALASLRASAKRDTHDSVGHFGVGFTAVLSWSAAVVPDAACSAGATPKKKAVRSVAPRV